MPSGVSQLQLRLVIERFHSPLLATGTESMRQSLHATPKAIFNAVWNHRLVILRKERLHMIPAHTSSTATPPAIVTRSGSTARKRKAAREPVAPADQGVAEHEPGLPGEQNGWNFDGSVGQDPAQEEDQLAVGNVVERDGAEDDAVIKQQHDRCRRPRSCRAPSVKNATRVLCVINCAEKRPRGFD
jgi:hypothetical protein